ncbi:MAG TPA: PQQ-binding-like beta-propeller repeat protein [Bacillota bacterium]|nr:PQQ-binding-like beta-propeller repeat protein [Bacillota bacterium]
MEPVDPTQEPKNSKSQFISHLVRNLMVIALVFSTAVAILLFFNYLYLKRYDPRNVLPIQDLFARISREPNNQELKELARGLDLITRKAFFTSLAFAKYGASLLFGGLAILVATFQTMRFLKRELPQPEKLRKAGAFLVSRLPGWLIGGLAALLMAAALVLPRSFPNLWGEPGEISESVASTVALVTTPIPIPTMGEPDANLKKTALTAPITEPAAIGPTDGEIQDNWPGFRGPYGNGIAGVISAQAPKEAPVDWDGDSGRGIIWKKALPLPGFNSPIIWNDRLFVTGANQEQRAVFCLNRVTGEILWQTSTGESPGTDTESPKVSVDTGFAAATMATDGRLVFAVFATGELVGVDFHGKVIWSRKLGVPQNPYGLASSLLCGANRLFVQYDQRGESKIMALDPATGQTLWEQLRPVTVSWATPILAKVGRDGASHQELILSANPVVIAYDPKSGREIWRIRCLSGEVASSPAYAGGITFVANEYAALTAIDNQAKKIIWQTRELELPNVSSVLAAGKYLIVPTASGVVSCLEAGTGAVLWRQEFEQGFYASPILVGERVYLMDRTGVMQIFKAGSAFEALGNPSLGEPVVCTPAFKDGRVYIRGQNNLYCIGEAP